MSRIEYTTRLTYQELSKKSKDWLVSALLLLAKDRPHLAKRAFFEGWDKCSVAMDNDFIRLPVDHAWQHSKVHKEVME